MGDGPAGALAGIRVADFSRVLAGPYATMMLADLGADVIKIESPEGDDTRRWLPPVDSTGTSTYFSSVNRNKRSLVCDLGTAAGRRRAKRLAVTADVVIENFKVGTMHRFGLGFEELRVENPKLVFCSITGFGSGAGAALPGYDLLVQAVGGLMSITGTPDAGPTKVGVAVVDVLTGLNAVVGIQAALRHAEQTGEGQRVEVNLLGSLLAGLVNQASSTLATGASPKRMGNEHPSIAPYETMRAADAPIAIAVGNDGQFRRLLGVLELDALADDERFRDNATRVANRPALRRELEAVLARRPAAEWARLLAAAGVPAGRVNSVSEAFELAESLGLGSVVEVVDQGIGTVVRQVASPLRMSSSPPTYRMPPPRLGQHPDADWLPREGEDHG